MAYKRKKNPVESTKNEHRFRVLEPSLFKQFRYKYIGLPDYSGKSRSGIVFVMGKYKKPINKRQWDIQSVRFDRDKWTLGEARKWFEKRFLGV